MFSKLVVVIGAGLLLLTSVPQAKAWGWLVRGLARAPKVEIPVPRPVWEPPASFGSGALTRPAWELPAARELPALRYVDPPPIIRYEAFPQYQVAPLAVPEIAPSVRTLPKASVRAQREASAPRGAEARGNGVRGKAEQHAVLAELRTGWLLPSQGLRQRWHTRDVNFY